MSESKSKSFDLNAFDLKYQRVIEQKNFNITFYDDYFDYSHHIIIETPKSWQKNPENQDDYLEDENGDPIVNEWQIVPSVLKLTVKKSSIGEIKLKWNEDDECHELTINTISGTVLEILFQKIVQYKELHQYLKNWTLNLHNS